MTTNNDRALANSDETHHIICLLEAYRVGSVIVQFVLVVGQGVLCCAQMSFAKLIERARCADRERKKAREIKEF